MRTMPGTQSPIERTGSMRRIIPTLLAIAMCAPAVTAAQDGNSAPAVRASYPAPAFLENLTVGDDGTLLFTSYLGKSIERLAADNTVSTFARLDVHPVSILPLDKGFVVAAHGVPFTAGPAFIGTSEILVLDASGAVTSRTKTPAIGFANGMVQLPGGALLVADSAAGSIHRFDPATGSLSLWFQDARLQPALAPAFLPGTNGLKLAGSTLLVSSSAARSLFAIALSDKGEPASPMMVRHGGLPGADDFIVTTDGSIFVATHGTAVVRIAPDGSVATVLDDPRIAGNTALAIRQTSAGRELIVLGTGGLAEGRGEPGIVLALPLPAQ